MLPLPSTPGDFLAPAPSGNQPVGSPPVGEESFSKRLAIETARESTDEIEPTLSHGKELVVSSPLVDLSMLEDVAPLGIAHSIASTNDQVPAAQQSQLAHTLVVPGDKNKDASPLMALLEKLSTKQSAPDPLAGKTQSISPSSAATISTIRAEVSAQPQKASALQQQMSALSEIVTPTQPTNNSIQADAPQLPQQVVKSTVPGTVHPTPGNQAAPSVTVEQWSATFSPVQAQPVDTENTAVSATPTGANVIKTESGQTITIYQSSDNEEMAVTTPLAARSSTVDQSGQRQDTNSNYIHSNMPNTTGKTALGAEGEQQAKNGGEQQPDQKALSTTNELGTESRLSRETSPIPFTLDSVAPTVTTPTSPTTSPGTGLMKLPSGATVYDSAVADQVINHFSSAKKLESGSIRLQLHPQELGELRMEIEVKQDNVKAHITAQNPQAQEALDRHLPRLRETLEQQGLHLNEVEITVAAGDQYDGNHFQQNSARHQLGKSYRHGNIPTTGTATITGEEPGPANKNNQGLSVTV